MRRVLLTIVGWVLTVTGIILFPLPGPGLLLIFFGLAVLAEQYDWAERRVDRVKAQAILSAARGVQTHPRAWVSIITTTLLAASGLLWLWAPAQPSWWALPAWTWLPGGFWAGVSQILSGLITLALVLWAYRNFHGRPEDVELLAGRLARDPDS